MKWGEVDGIFWRNVVGQGGLEGWILWWGNRMSVLDLHILTLSYFQTLVQGGDEGELLWIWWSRAERSGMPSEQNVYPPLGYHHTLDI